MTEPVRTDSRTEWEVIKDLFGNALEIPADQRTAWIESQTANDATVRAQVLSLIQAHESTGDFMETPAVVLAGGIADAHDVVFGGPARVGPYRLIREIGRGGMGTVYLATRDDGQFAQDVAIKLVKRGMDTDAIISRFRHERQILARLEHPNIARLLDGGTTDDGVPYFVMEYVQGSSLRDYCAERGSTLEERLKLFRTVCDAVQYAHQNLIVHRDIKSSNIIVSSQGVPKLLDFGIARVLHPTASETAIENAARPATETISALTPEYASPEQLRGDAVTTATDVYSLGVLLYEMLAGQRPFARDGLRHDELVRAVCDTDPLPPSANIRSESSDATSRTLRGDLDNVVLMAIRKEPERRYSSVERFSDDIGRYLEKRPVLAQPNTWGYRTRKYIARNRAALSVGALLLVTMVGGVAATIWQARVAQSERARAERRFAEVRSLATTFLFDVHDEIATLEGSTAARALLVKRGLQSLDGLLAEAEGDTLLERELSEAYQRLGLVQGNTYNANLGESDAALKSYRTSVELLSRSTDTTSQNANALHRLSLAYHGYANMLGITGDLKSAIQNLELSLAAERRAVALDSTNFEYRRALADLHYVMGDMYGGAGVTNVGDTKSSLNSYKQAILLREQLRRQSPKDPEVRGGLANAKMNLGSLQLSLGDTAGAKQLEEGVAILEQLTAELPDNAARRTNLLSGYIRRRRPLADAGRFIEAMKVDSQVLSMLKEMVKSDPENKLLKRNLGVTYNTLGFDLVGAGFAGEGVKQYREAVQIVEGLRRADPASAEMKQDLAFTTNALGDALRSAGKHREAITGYDRSLPIKLDLLKSEPENPRHSGDLAAVYAGRGAARTAIGEFAGAEDDFRLAQDLAEKEAAKPDASAKTRSGLAILYSRIGQLHAARGKSASFNRKTECTEATTWYNKSLEVWKQLEDRREITGANSRQPALVSAMISECQL